MTGQYKDSGGSRPVRPVKAMTTGMDQNARRQAANTRNSGDKVKNGKEQSRRAVIF